MSIEAEGMVITVFYEAAGEPAIQVQGEVITVFYEAGGRQAFQGFAAYQAEGGEQRSGVTAFSPWWKFVEGGSG